MKSIIELKILANGNLVDITTNANKIYEGAIATTEYHLTVENDWRATDLVWLTFKRPDNLQGQFKMKRHETLPKWVLTTNGWETDGGFGVLKTSALMKRYSTIQIGKIAVEKATEVINLFIHESAGYIPQNIEIEPAELLQEQINDLELDKVGRYDAINNGQDIPPHITFVQDGAKSENNIYYNFKSTGLNENGLLINLNGALLVLKNDNTQNEFLFTETGEIYERKITNNVASDFRPTQLVFYENVYTKMEADARFVHLFGNEVITGTKDFADNPKVPTATADSHAIPKSQLENYAYDKDEVDRRIKRLTRVYSFETQQQFFDWLDGVYQRPDGVVKSDLEANNKIIIIEANVPNYLVAKDNPQNINDFKELIEDIKALEEITTRPYKNIEATDGQEFVEELKDQIDLKSQIARIEVVEIKSDDWVSLGDGLYSFTYHNDLFVDAVNQQPFFMVEAEEDYNKLLENDILLQSVLTVDESLNITLKARAEEPIAIDLNLTFGLAQVQQNTIDGIKLNAEMIDFSNAGTQMIATTVQEAIEELKGETDFNFGEIQDLKDDKLDKKIIPDTVYAVDSNGEQENIAYSETATNNSLAKRDSAGRLQTKDAVNDDDAVNFKQLNSLGFGKLIFEKTVNVYSGASPLDFNDFITPLVLEPFKKYALKFLKVDMWEDPGKAATIILKGRTAEYATINMSNGSISKHGGGGSDTDIMLRLTSVGAGSYYGGDISTPTVYLKTRIGSNSQLRYVWESENYDNMLKTMGSTPSDIDIETSISGIVGDGSYFILTLKIYKLEV